ncbi:MerR family transcriptional regulator [Streptosporangium sp. NPDC020145]|uniref:MerR family transcriptional regulator n=1 Tax=Streptosporangium sp. NPDC020145 TaxID=3154694 RepID=UPI003441FC11
MRISEVAARSGVPATTLRYYDGIGLIHAGREPNGYRDYDETVLGRLAFIEAAQRLGLALPEIAELLVVVEGDTCTQVREALHPKLAQRLQELDAHLANLHLLRDRLAAATDQVAACPDSGASCRSECMLLARPHGPCRPGNTDDQRKNQEKQ